MMRSQTAATHDALLPAADPAWAGLTGALRERLGPGLRALLLFGSCQSPELQRQGSIPDVLALVDDLDVALLALSAGRLAQVLGGRLPPLILRFDWGGGAAKLNLIAAGTARQQVQELPDLYLAGRLSKRCALLYARDLDCQHEIERLCADAARALAGLAVLCLPVRATLTEALLVCLSLSYRGELRPERTADKVDALYRAFAGEYQARYRPLLIERATALGLRFDGEVLHDVRPAAARRAGRRALRRALWRSRLRFVARMLRQAVVYRGAAAYSIRKLARSRW